MPVTRLLLIFSVFLLVTPTGAAAQTPDQPPTVRVGGYIQYDFLAPLGERTILEQTFRFRRVRLAVGGTVTQNVEYLVTVEATNTPILRDAFIRLTHLPAATIQVGQFMMPYGLEQSVFSSNTLEFTERLLTPLVPARDAGIMVSNATPFGGWFTYAAAIANGTGMNVRDHNDAKDAMLRFTAAPPRLPGLRMSVNGVRGDQVGGVRTRGGADITFERKHYHLAAEFQRETFESRRHRDGYYLFGSWRYYPSSPARYFHHVEFGSRYGKLTVDESFAQVEFAANYYVQANLRFMCDFIVHTERAFGSPGRTLHARANVRF